MPNLISLEPGSLASPSHGLRLCLRDGEWRVSLWQYGQRLYRLIYPQPFPALMAMLQLAVADDPEDHATRMMNHTP